MSNLDSLKYIGPELILAVGILFILLFDIIFDKKRILPYLTLGVLVLAFISVINLMACGLPAKGISLFNNLMVLNGFTIFFKLLFLVGTAFTVLFAISRSKMNSFLSNEAENGVEYYSLLLVSNIGLFLLSSAGDLLTVYIGLETVSLCSYMLVAYHKGVRKSSEAGLKYVIYGAIASGIMLYGMAFFYGICGTTELSKLFINGSFIQTIMLLMVFLGLSYKIAAVPMHMWCPDVYEGAPTEITAFLSVMPKAAGFAIILRFFMGMLVPAGMPGGIVSYNFDWQTVFAVVSVATMTLGNLAALHQTNIKRMLAYSSIAHAGYMLMGLVVLNKDGIEAILMYLPIYLFMNMGAFLIVYIVEKATNKTELSQYEGLGWHKPFLGVLLAIFLFSLIGLPPFAGFIGKLYIFKAVIIGKWYLLAVIGVLNGAVSLYYYARIIRAMFLNKAPEQIHPELFQISTFDSVLAVIFVIPTLVLGVYFTPLINLIGWLLN